VVLRYAKDAPNLDTNNQSPEYLSEEEEFKQKLTNAIASLSEAQRSIFIESNRWKNTEKSLNY
jgi:RNA polymerase sigma-70 factor (ECF subfamily)